MTKTGRTLEGTEVYGSLRRSQLTGWTFALGIPVSVVEAGARNAAWTLGPGLLGALGLAAALAYLVGRRIARPIVELASVTKAIGRGESSEVPTGAAVAEIRSLQAALRAAVQAVHDRDLMAREQIALREADRAKDEFLATVNHELRNPLAGLMAAIHVLKAADADAQDTALAKGIMERQTRHMARLVEDLLDISRLKMGKMTLHLEPCDLAQVACDMVDAWRSGRRFARHQVSLQGSAAWVQADRARMEQILANLLENALKFTPDGGTITVTARREKDEAIVQVTDSGAGLAPEALGRVFDLFVQSHESPRSGLGVGLALVKRLVELHGGGVSASSDGPGRGASFVVRLPAVDAPREEMPAASPRQHGAPRRILVIDDNDDVREALCAALSLGGHVVQAAADGATGLVMAADASPDIVLVDIGLPDMDGYEVARRLRAGAARNAMILVALSGYGQMPYRVAALEAGFDAHLTKPVELDRLQQTLADLLNERGSVRAV